MGDVRTDGENVLDEDLAGSRVVSVEVPVGNFNQVAVEAMQPLGDDPERDGVGQIY